MKAYIIELNDDEGYCGVFFGNKPSQAKSQAVSETSYDYIDLKCQRDPSLDKFAPGPIPIKNLIEKGWWFSCFGCGEKIGEDGYYNKETDSYTDLIYIDNENIFYGIKGEVFCCQDCLDNTIREKQEIQENKQKAEKIIKERFPEATNINCRGNPNRMPTYLDFSLPGLKNSIYWNTEDKEYLVSRCDVENFSKYKNESSLKSK